jgi:hypothetical protein
MTDRRLLNQCELIEEGARDRKAKKNAAWHQNRKKRIDLPAL